ncbi:Creatinase/aminopeptidase [Xylaria arbuscula]|nr:Creatinase/aminopeptidase [Xylaria arbuscula]
MILSLLTYRIRAAPLFLSGPVPTAPRIFSPRVSLTNEISQLLPRPRRHAYGKPSSHVSLPPVPPISRSDFLTRQSRLASALQYYANISARFSLSERPYLISFDSAARFSYLVPQFETGRLNPALQHMSSAPVLCSSRAADTGRGKGKGKGKRKGKGEWKGEGKIMVIVDDHARHTIAAGLQSVGVDVVPMSNEVKQLRGVRTEVDVAILKGINAFTLQLVRALQGYLPLGLTQENIWGMLHGYGSDVTRTMLPPGGASSEELMGICQTRMQPNDTCRDSNAASMVPVEEAGHGLYFTPRLGHGLRLAMHEHSYLNSANYEKLRVGVVATNKPQAARLGKSPCFSVRLGNPIFVTEDGACR